MTPIKPPDYNVTTITIILIIISLFLYCWLFPLKPTHIATCEEQLEQAKEYNDFLVQHLRQAKPELFNSYDYSNLSTSQTTISRLPNTSDYSVQFFTTHETIKSK